MCESIRSESAANRARIAATEAAKQARNAASASQSLTKQQKTTALRRRKAADKANTQVKEQPKVVECKKEDELIRCGKCGIKARRGRMMKHLQESHYLGGMTEAVRKQFEYLIESAKVIQRPAITAQQKKKRNFTYQASAEFVAERLSYKRAQRHNKDSVSLRPDYEIIQSTEDLHILNLESAALEKLKKEQAQQKRLTLISEKSAQGLTEVVVGCVVTLCYIEENETVSYYVLSDEIRGYRGQIPVYVENYDTPPYGADECLRADSKLAKVVGAFVGDEVEVRVPAGVLKCRVVSVINHTGGKSNEPATATHREMSEGQTHARIGSEAYAFLARDNGSFGSFVSHDDYSDEADAEVHGAEAYENERELSDDYE